MRPAVLPDELGRLADYRVLRKLGQGGMGLVFEAEDVRLKRRVALKVMKPEVAAKELHRQRFLREAQTAAQVEHDHICPIYQVGDDNGVPYIAMPFLKGEPLDAVVKRGGVSLDDAIRYAREVALGLAVAHDAGLVHRDIKPANVWLETIADRPPRVRILDFGLARSAKDDVHLTASGAILGTPAYMAPDQARGKEVDGRADLFSLGVMLYEMTTGRRPFTGPDTMAILTSLAIDDPNPPMLVNPDIPPELSDLILKLLEKKPERRPKDARQVAETLLGVLLQMSRPKVEVIPQAEAVDPPTAGDATAVDPWNRIDESSMATADALPKRPSEKPKPKAKRRERMPVVLGGLALVLLIVGAYAIFRTVTKPAVETGTATLAFADADTQARFQNGEVQLINALGTHSIRSGDRALTLPPGRYEVKLTGADGLELDSTNLAIVAGKEATIQLRVKGTTIARKDPLGEIPLPKDVAVGELVPFDASKIPAEERYDWQPKELVAVLGTHRWGEWSTALAVAYSGDGGIVGTICRHPRGIRLWNPADGRMVAFITFDAYSSSAFHPDRKTLIENGGTLRLYDLSKSPPTLRQELPGGNHRVAVSPGGNFLFAEVMEGQTHHWRSWPYQNGKLVGAGMRLDLPSDILRYPVNHAFSPDGKFAAVVDSQSSSVELWSLTAGAGRKVSDQPVGKGGGPWFISFSPDGRRIILAADKIRIFDIEGDHLRSRSECDRGHAGSPALSVDGTTLAIPGYRELGIYDVQGDRPSSLASLDGVWGAVAWHPSGKSLAVVEGSRIRFVDWDAKSRKLSLRGGNNSPPGFIWPMQYDSASGSLFCVHPFDATVTRWKFDPSGLRRLRPIGPMPMTHANVGNRISYSDSSKQFLIDGKSSEGTAVWDLRTETPFRFDQAEKLGHFQAATRDGRRAFFGRTEKAYIVSIVGGKLQKPSYEFDMPPNSSVNRAEFLPDGKTLLMSCGDLKLRVWEIAEHQATLIQTIDSPVYQRAFVNQFALSSDGELLVVPLTQNGALGIWDRVQGEYRLRGLHPGALPGTDSRGAGIAISPDKKYYATAGGANGPAAVWPIPSAEELKLIEAGKLKPKPLWSWQPPGYQHDVAFLPDGHLALGNGNGTVYIVKLPAAEARLAIEPEEAKQQQADEAKKLGVATETQNKIGMKLTLIPPGTFQMGSPENEPGRSKVEGPQRWVTISKPFWLGTTEVTVGQFREFVLATKREMPKGALSGPDLKPDDKLSWDAPGWEQSFDHPVTCVNWNDAVAFCKWLSEREKRTYRLPTEAEWEYACRAGTRTRFYFGNDDKDFGEYGFKLSNSKGRSAAVGKAKPNAWGLRDMLGNAWEWCADRNDRQGYDPKSLLDPTGPTSGDVRMLRGGGWCSGAPNAEDRRSAARWTWNPMTPDVRWNGAGFRVVCEIEAPKK